MKFYLNRFLRIYPAYWIMMIVAVLMIIYFPDASRVIDGRAHYLAPFESAYNLSVWISNILLYPTTSLGGATLSPQFIPPTWSVGVEILYWLFVPALLLSRKLFWAVFVLSILLFVFFNVLIYMQYYAPEAYYFNPLGAMTPFFAGISIYYLKRRKIMRIPHWAAFIIIGIQIAFMRNSAMFNISEKLTEAYVSALIGFFMIYYLSHINSRGLPKLCRNLDMLLGHMSYGMLLTHQFIAAYVYTYLGLKSDWWASLTLFYSSYPLICAAGLLIYVVIEIPMDRLRAKLRE